MTTRLVSVVLAVASSGCDAEESTRLVEHDIVWIGIPWVQGDDGSWLLVDTGAPRSIIAPPASFDLVGGSTVETSLEDWSPLGHVSGVPILVSDASVGDIATRPAPYGGILGLDVLEQHPFLFDSRDNRLYVGNLDDVRLQTTACRTKVPVERLGAGTLCLMSGFCVPFGPNRIVFEISVGGVNTWAILDTGSGVSLMTAGLISRISARHEVPSLISTSDSDSLSLNLHRVDLTLGNDEAHNTIAGTGFEESLFAKLQVETGRPVEVVLGWSSLDNFAVEVDARSPSLHLHAYSDPAEPRTVHGTGMLLRAGEGECYRVSTIDEEQPANLAGVRLHDCVVSVNGDGPGKRPAGEVNRDMATSELGTTFDLVFTRGSREFAVALEVVDMLPVLSP